MLINVAFKNLKRNPRRTLVSILTVAMGACALLLFHGFNNGIMNQYRDNTIHSRFGHGQINTLGYRDTVYEKPWEHWIENTDAVLATLHDIPSVEHVFPRIEFSSLLTNGQITVSGHGIGIDGRVESDFFNTINLVKGANLNDHEDGMIMGLGLARALGVEPGDRVTVLTNTVYGSINGFDAKLTGVFHTGLKEVDDSVFKIQLSQAQILLDTPKIESIALGLSEKSTWDEFFSAFSKNLPNLQATPFEVLDKVYYQHAVDWLNQQFYVIQVIILLIVTLGIGNTISFTILERKREIGNLRANGESAGEVLRLLLFEGLFLGLLGAITGVIFAIIVDRVFLTNGILMPPAPGITRQYNVKLDIEGFMIMTTLGLSIVTALIATFIIGLKVSRIPIGEALRAK